tara:strand:+ start:199 stop:2550 length:2352 start_codon:yes stop_codon:yes gene_type:complete
MFKLINFSLKALIIILISSLILIFSAFFYFSSGLPDYKKLSDYQPPISSRVYSKDGKLIAEYALEKRLFVPYDSIPRKVINAFLSAEDKNFFNHPGVDAKGIIRATVNNIKNILGDKRLEGASTITQQVAKNFLLTNEVSLKRKIKEAILAFRIEKAYSKKRILELYLNQIYLGQGTYGVAAASLEYFDKSIKDLEYDEAALLAALPKAPSRYNPIKDPNEAKFRRDLVLKNLNQNGFINNEQYLDLKEKKIKVKRRKIEIVNEANSYTEEVRRIIKNKYGFEKLYTQGLSIKSPLNIKFQIEAIKALRDGIEAYDRRHGWRGPITNKNKDINWKQKLDNFDIDPTLKWEMSEITEINENYLILNSKQTKNIKIKKSNLKWVLRDKDISNVFELGDFVFTKKNNNNWNIKQYPNVNGGIVALNPYTGEVKALVGGFSYASSEFNRVTQAKRQPGSAFKPFVYAAAIENGLSPNSIILDAPFIAEQGIGLKDWKPENYGKKFYGPSTLRKGIEYSRNLMTVRIAKNLGLNKILDLSRELEIYDEIPELLSVSLGSVETSLLNLTSAYATFVNGGKKIKPVLINRIQDRRGKTIFLPDFAECKGCDRYTENKNEEGFPKINFKNNQVISEQTAYQITSILKGVITRGTGKKLKDLKVPIAGKTGTTNNNFDAWFIGYNSNLVVGVYIGFDNPKSLGKYETGSKAALPIFKSFIKGALYLDDFEEFDVPNGIYFAPINYNTGKQTDFDDKSFILEAFKKKDINNLNNKQLISNYNYDKLIKFRQFY